MQEFLQMERHQLKENIKEAVTEEHQQTISTRNIPKETDQEANIERDVENSDAESQEKIQELREKEHQLLKMNAVNETQEKIWDMEYFKNQFEAQKSTLENIEMENVRLTQRLHENLEEMKSVTKERDDLKSIEETLKVERDQLEENLRETVIRELEKQEELRIAYMHVKEYQETIDKLKGLVSEKTDEISNMQMDLESSNAALKAQELEKQEELRIAYMHVKEHQETIVKLKDVVSEKTDEISNMQMDLENSNAKLKEKIQQLKANEHQLFKLKEDVSESQKKMSEIERLRKQFKAQSLTLDKIEMENLNLAQKLHENLEEMKSVMKERDNLKLERDQLQANLQETIAR
ncbi:hypothetical protein PANDA_022330, partial [Ailuropoda melanoleuca]